MELTIYPVAFDFLQPYCEEGEVRFVDDLREAKFVLTMNQVGDWPKVMETARKAAISAGIPLCWWTCEDPNSYRFTIHQARLADYVFTSDACLIPRYRQDLGHERIYWLPLAASEQYHRPLPLAEDATDFVFSGNWYDFWRDGNQWTTNVRNEARKWGSETVFLPLARAGYSMTIFSYEPPPYPELVPFWKGLPIHGCRSVAEQYTHGRVVLGNNNQRSGLGGIENTVMCSMRVFEALACGKPFLSPWTEAYERLGFENGRHLTWVPIGGIHSTGNAETEVMIFADVTFGTCSPADQYMAERGRNYVLNHHLYRHRMARISRAIRGEADPEDWP